MTPETQAPTSDDPTQQAAPNNQPQPKSTATVENKGIIESLLFLKTNNLIKESKSQIKFETTKEAEDSAKEEVVASIIEKTNDLKQNISEMQKKGNNLKLDGIKLLQIPLKTKVWLSTTSKKDLEIIFNILSSVEKILAPIKIKETEKEQEKELLEKQRDAAEKSSQKPTAPKPEHPKEITIQPSSAKKERNIQPKTPA